MCQALKAMENQDSQANQPHAPIELANFFRESAIALENPPKYLTLLPDDEPITDEMLLRLNPEWQSLKSLDKETKKKIKIAATHYGVPEHLKIPRALIALAICIGANPSKTPYPLSFSAYTNDLHLTHYLLAKGASPKNKWSDISSPLMLSRTVQMAQLLIDHGAPLEGGELYTACIQEEDTALELLKFYLKNGAYPDSSRIIRNMGPFHFLCGDHPIIEIAGSIPKLKLCSDISPLSLAKTELLLKYNIPPYDPNGAAFTPLHLAARIKTKNAQKFCAQLIHYYVKRYKGLLTFLWWLKNNYPLLHAQKMLLKQYFIHCTDNPLRMLREFISKRDSGDEGSFTAFDYWPIDLLNPYKKSYEEFAMSLRSSDNAIITTHF